MLTTLPMQVVAARRDGRKKAANKGDVITNLLVSSPFLAQKKQGPQAKKQGPQVLLANVNPFWAILRGKDPKSLNNMELHNIVVSDPGFEVQGSKFLKSTVGFSLEVPILRNVCHIEAGEILCLPFAIP